MPWMIKVGTNFLILIGSLVVLEMMVLIMLEMMVLDHFGATILTMVKFHSGTINEK